MSLSPTALHRAPKVVLHDHLDGGLRPETIIELAEEVGHRLPESDAAALQEWFVTSASSGSLPTYLTTFEHTVAVMQTEAGLRRVAQEAVEDLAADGVVLAELRYAPEQHQRAGLSLEQVVEAVQQGLRDGETAVAASGRVIRTGTLVTAMRHADRGLEIARLAQRYRDEGVVGFDIAGAEAGFPASRLSDAFQSLRESLMRITIHAGEAAGAESIADALGQGAQRVGHGVRITEDIAGFEPGAEPNPSVRLGRVAQNVLDRQVPLEMCPSSNVQTGAVASLAEHPIDALRRLGFNVTVNTDNRLMSDTSMSQEMSILVEQFDYTLEDLRDLTLAALHASFLPHEARHHLETHTILPLYTPASPL